MQIISTYSPVPNYISKNILFLQLIGRYTIRGSTIRGTTRLYPRPIFFNIFIHDIFIILKTTYFDGYADDSMPFVVADDTTDALKALK